MKFNSWSECRKAADLVVKDDNFITAFVDGVGIGTAARRSPDWAFIPIGANTAMGASLDDALYAELKAQAQARA